MTKTVPDSDASEFRHAVLERYRLHGRSFPWRETQDPWAILVSEVMLQQTQTARVVKPYIQWMEQWPTAASLADANLSDLYQAWSGLGYNSRAMRLRDSARLLCSEYGGKVPDDEKALRSLPGVGSYTARAVLAFAFHRPVVLVETNIRAAIIFHFFQNRNDVRDTELEPVLEAIMLQQDPRSWYYALMDYGAWLKTMEPNPSRRSSAYAKQTAFNGSLRQARGAALRAIQELGASAKPDIQKHSGVYDDRMDKALQVLVKEGLLSYESGLYRFSD